MLSWGIEDENKQNEEATKGKKPKSNPKGGSSADGEKISSVSQLMSIANQR